MNTEELEIALQAVTGSPSKATPLLVDILEAAKADPAIDVSASVKVCCQLIAAGYTPEQLRECKGIFPASLTYIAEAAAKTEPHMDALLYVVGLGYHHKGDSQILALLRRMG